MEDEGSGAMPTVIVAAAGLSIPSFPLPCECWR